ncbi:MAG: hypothetical protein JW936_07880 [Sedimentisphaerales bacterium]|nr:hypothetical protein [Sedimentisphaerales bacterium]
MYKTLLHIFLTAMLVCVASAVVLAQDTTEPNTEDEIWQVEQLDGNNPPGPGRCSRGGPPMQGPECMPGMMYGGMGMPGGMGPHGMSGMPEPGEYIERLHEFLAEYEPSLAAFLSELRENDPDRYNSSIGTVVRHYGPIMQQMEQDPEMAQLNLRKTRLTLEVEQAVRAAQDDSKTDAEITEATELLRTRVAELFNLIMEQQHLELDRTAERLEGMRQWHALLQERMAAQDDEENPPSSAAPGAAPGGPMAGGHRRMGGFDHHGQDWGQRRCQEMENRLEEHRQQLENWSENAEAIIDSRVNQLLTGGDPFPW